MNKAPDAFRTISEVADELDVPQHVLRFWESRFQQIRPMKRGGGRRYYRPDDVDLLRGIRHLLYGEGYTIRGVQRILRDQGPKFVQSVWQAGAEQPQRDPADGEEGADIAGEAATAAGADTERGLFSLLPSGRRDESVADAAAAGPTVRAQPQVTPQLGSEDMRRLAATLEDLMECRRLIDAALADGH